MSSDGGLEDFSLMDLFRSEVETHSEVLSTALLALERAPEDTSRVDEMMRAAHSIKGAARVVGVDQAVGVAHVMEDCFVAAQKGKLTLTPADVDVLLRGVDLLGKISESTRDPKVDIGATFDETVRGMVVELEALLAPRPAKPPPPPPAPEPAPAPTPPPPVMPTAPPEPEPAASAPETRTRPKSRSKGKSSAAESAERGTTLAFPEFLDQGAAEELRRKFLDAFGRGGDLIQLDLGRTTDLDVQGLALLAAIPRHAARHGGPRVRLSRVSTEIEAVLNVTGLGAAYASRAGSSAEEG